MLFEVKTVDSERQTKNLVITVNGELIAVIRPNEEAKSYLLLDNSVERETDKYLVEGDKKLTFRIPKEQYETFGMYFNPEHGIRIYVLEDGQEKADRGKVWDYYIPVKNGWVVDFRNCMPTWMKGELWLNIPRQL